MNKKSWKEKIQSRIFSNKTDFYAVLSTLLISSVMSLAYLKGSLGDANYYISNGKKLLLGENIYLEGFRSGPVGAVTLYIFSTLIPNTLTEFILLLCNLIGPLTLVAVLFKKNKDFIKYWPILITFSAFRELLGNLQVNGLIYMLISVHVVSRKSTKTSIRLLGILSATVALDLKPHLVLPILLSLIIMKNDWKNLLKIGSLTLLLHTVVNLRLGTITEIRWIQNLKEISSANGKSNWADIFNIWPVINHFTNTPDYLKIIASLTFVTVLFLLPILSTKLEPNIAIYTAFASPLIGVYAHLYDLVPFFLISFLYLKKIPVHIFFWFFVDSVILFRGIDNLGSLLFLIMINLFLILNKLDLVENSKHRLARASVLGILVHYLFHQLARYYVHEEILMRSVLISFIGFSTFFVTIHAMTNSKRPSE